jgi:hypothetical protein
MNAWNRNKLNLRYDTTNALLKLNTEYMAKGNKSQIRHSRSQGESDIHRGFSTGVWYQSTMAGLFQPYNNSW